MKWNLEGIGPLLAARQIVKAWVKAIELPWRRFGAYFRSWAGQVNVETSPTAVWGPTWIFLVGILMLLRKAQAHTSAMFRWKTMGRARNSSHSPVWKRWLNSRGKFASRQQKNHP